MLDTATLIEDRPKMTERQRDLLLDTLAYIETHKAEWKQNEWRCKTGMCFAGHATLTLRSGRPVLGIEDLENYLKAKRKLPRFRTNKEHDAVSLWQRYADALHAVQADGATAVETEIKGKKVKIVTIAERASRLLGGYEVVSRAELAGEMFGRREYEGDLFGGDNRLTELRTHIAAVLGMTLNELRTETGKRASRHGWK